MILGKVIFLWLTQGIHIVELNNPCNNALTGNLRKSWSEISHTIQTKPFNITGVSTSLINWLKPNQTKSWEFCEIF